MKTSDKIRVAVLFGGRSAEHEVSIQSATNVIQYLDPQLFEIVPIGIDKKGNWFLGNDVFKNSLTHRKVSQIEREHTTWFTPEWVGKPTETLPEKKHPITLASSDKYFDVVFPVVHGTLCEDGTLQGLLELANLPYVGCGVLSSAIGMDKDISKRLAAGAGVLIPPYLVLKLDQWKANETQELNRVLQEITLPIFVKPANTGSSIGISKVKTKEQLKTAIQQAFEFGTKIVIGKALNILELELAVLESLEANAEPIVSVVGEVKPRHEFYSYDAKYVDDDGAELLIPAPIDEEMKHAAQSVARKLFKILECEGMARVDLFLNKDDNKIYFNEINTIPGFTQISMYPKLMAASGMPYSNLLTHLIQLAIKRHQCKSKLKRSYAD